MQYSTIVKQHLDSSLKIKAVTNIEILDILKRGNISTSELETLCKFVGWGTLAPVLDGRFPEIADEIRGYLPDYADLNSDNAFYTGAFYEIVWEALARLGFTHGRILEPSAGSGHAAIFQPQENFEKSEWAFCEIDATAANVLRYLFPESLVYGSHDYTHKQFGFQDLIAVPDESVDLAISNVPFGLTVPNDTDFNHFKLKTLHDYFFLKSIMKVRHGGLLAFITSTGTMDKEDSTFRKLLNKYAELCFAVRLPNTTFKQFGTQVCADLIVMRRRLVGDVGDDSDEWLDTYVWKYENGSPIRVNRYWKYRQSHVLGNWEVCSMYGGQNRMTVTPIADIDIKQAVLAAASESDFRYIEDEKPDSLYNRCLHPDLSDIDPYSYVEKEGRIYQLIDTKLVLVQNKGDSDRIRQVMKLADTLDQLADAELDSKTPDEDLVALRNQLNLYYDEFVERWGYLTNTKNRNLLRDDTRLFQTIFSLELEERSDDPHELTPVKIVKADIFFKRCSTPATGHVEHVQHEVDALHASLNRNGKIDIEYMAGLLQRDENVVINALQNWQCTIEQKDGTTINEIRALIYYNPTTEEWERRSTYLSGYTRDKLAIVENIKEVDPEKFEQYLLEVNERDLLLHQPKYLLPPIEPGTLSVEGRIDIADRLGGAAVCEMDTSRHIIVKLGAIWVPAHIIKEFICHLLQLPEWQWYMVNVWYVSATATWIVQLNDDAHSIASTSQYKTDDAPMLHLFTETLNLRDVKIDIKIRDRDKEVRDPEASRKATEAANAVQAQFRDEFNKWIWTDVERAYELTQEYNKRFPGLIDTEFDGSYLRFPGMNPEWERRMYKHQRDSVEQAICISSSLYSHEVGTGKSLSLIASIMKAKQLGLVTKPVLTLMNATVGQIVSLFREVYPHARLLVSDLDNTGAEARRRLFARIRTGNYDCIIIPHSQFFMIPVLYESIRDYIEDQINQAKACKEQLVEGCVRQWETRAVKDYMDRQIKELQKQQESAEIPFLLEEAIARNDRDTINRLQGEGWIGIDDKGKVTCYKKPKKSKQKEDDKARDRATERVEKAMLSNRKDKVTEWERLGIDGLWVDECFPYRTPVLTDMGWIQIGQIVENKLEVNVLSKNIATGKLEWKPVIAGFSKSSETPIVRVKHEHGEFICTANHPVWTNEEGYVEAKNLTTSHGLSRLRNDFYPQPGISEILQPPMFSEVSEFKSKSSTSDQELRVVWTRVPVQVGRPEERQQAQVLLDSMRGQVENESTRSSGLIQGGVSPLLWTEQRQEKSRAIGSDDGSQDGPRGYGEGCSEASRKTLYWGEGREFQGRSLSGEVSDRLEQNRQYGVCDTYSSSQEPIREASDLLQNRHCDTGSEASDRSRWQIAQNQEGTGERPEEGCSAECSRVVCVENLERGDREGFEWGDRPGRVYDIEVAGNHNFFIGGDAGNVLVSNCHVLKNLYRISKLENVAGLSNPYTQRSIDAYIKIRHITDNLKGKVVFATGTPVSNTMAEWWAIQRYLGLEDMKYAGVDYFDAWASVFGEITTDIEITSTGGMKRKARFRRFNNLFEFFAMLNRFTSFVRADQTKIVRPKLNRSPILAPCGPDQDRFLDQIIWRNEKCYEGKPVLYFKRHEAGRLLDEVQIKKDNFLVLTHIGALNSVDPRLVNPNAQNFGDSKVNALAHNVYSIWKATEKERLTQLVFCDISTPKPGGLLQMYVYLKDVWTGLGVPSEEVAFIHDHEGKKRSALLDKVRNGEVRVLIVSTEKGGTGVNVQDRVIAIHNLDLPWTPARLEQRIGRGWRQGNKNRQVWVFDYLTEGRNGNPGFDSFKAQTLENKAVFIHQTATGKPTVQSFEDIGEDAATYQINKALASGDPGILEYAQVKDELLKKSAVLQSRKNALTDSMQKLREFPKTLEDVKIRVEALLKDQELLDAVGGRLADEDGTFKIKLQIDEKGPVNEFGPKQQGDANITLVTMLEGLVARNKSKKNKSTNEHQIGEIAGFPIWCRIVAGNIAAIWCQSPHHEKLEYPSTVLNTQTQDRNHFIRGIRSALYRTTGVLGVQARLEDRIGRAQVLEQQIKTLPDTIASLKSEVSELDQRVSYLKERERVLREQFKLDEGGSVFGGDDDDGYQPEDAIQTDDGDTVIEGAMPAEYKGVEPWLIDYLKSLPEPSSTDAQGNPVFWIQDMIRTMDESFGHIVDAQVFDVPAELPPASEAIAALPPATEPVDDDNVIEMPVVKEIAPMKAIEGGKKRRRELAIAGATNFEQPSLFDLMA